MLFRDRDSNAANFSSFFIFRLLEDFEIALPVSRFKFLLLSNLGRTSTLPLVDVEAMLRRRYTMPFAPVGFWRRLVTHLHVHRKEMILGQTSALWKNSEVNLCFFLEMFLPT